MWSVSPDARPGGDPPTGYADLGRWLARTIAPTKTRLRDIETAGREIGRGLAPGDASIPAEIKMHSTLAAMGFAPERTSPGQGELTYELGNCPYREAVVENQPAVCMLHRGITQGLLDELSPQTKLTGFVPKDPMSAGCLIELRGPMADAPAGE
jgi:predicted ArsR family transcriptional regulator